MYAEERSIRQCTFLTKDFFFFKSVLITDSWKCRLQVTSSTFYLKQGCLRHWIWLAVAWASLAKSWLPEMFQRRLVSLLHYPFGQEFFHNVQYEYSFLSSSTTKNIVLLMISSNCRLLMISPHPLLSR